MNSGFKRLAVAATFALAFGASGAVASTLLIDDFSVDQSVADDPIGGIPASSTVGNRTFTVDNRAASAPFEASLRSGGASDSLVFSNNTDVSGIATIDWVFASMDFSFGDSFLLDLLSFDLFSSIAEIGFTVNGVTYSRDIGIGDIGTLEFSFASFAGVDFANVTSLSLSVDAIDAPGLDVSFDNLRVNAVPVPAAGFLMLTALGGLVAVRRRRKT